MKVELIPNVLKLLEDRKEYHKQQSLKGGVTDEFRLEHIGLAEEYSIALRVLKNEGSVNGGKSLQDE